MYRAPVHELPPCPPAQWVYNTNATNATVDSVNVPVNYTLTVNNTLLHGTCTARSHHQIAPPPGYHQSDIRLSLDGLAALLTAQGVQSAIRSDSITLEATLDRPDLPSTGTASLALALPAPATVAARSGRLLRLDVQRTNVTLPVTLQLLVAECAVVANQGGGADVLSQALKNPQLQDLGQRTPLLMLLQRNGFCGRVQAYLGPSTATGFPLDQTAYVASVEVNATVTLVNVPVAVNAASDTSAPQPVPLFGFTYAVQERVPSREGSVRVDGWQACAMACADAPLCVGWTHRTTVR